MTSTPASVAGNDGRIIELDSIRGLAAVGVLVTHLPRGFWFGETGVDLFFVLSGYLITSIILRYRDQPGFLRAFYYRRALRIFPIYYLALLIVLGINSVRHAPSTTEGIVYYFLYAQNIHYYWGQIPPEPSLSLGHTWTLAIEEQFYFLWPAVIVFLKPRRALPICLLLIVLPVLLRSQGLHRYALFGHTDGLALGSCLAFAGVYYNSAFSRVATASYLTCAIAAFVAYAVLWTHLSTQGATGKFMIYNTYGIILVSIGYFGLVGFVVGISGSRAARILRFQPLVWIGTISYGLYLYHWIIYETLDTYFKFGLGYPDPWWLDVAKVSLTFIAATTSWYLIERPLLKLKNAVSYRAKESRAKRTPQLESATNPQQAVATPRI